MFQLSEQTSSPSRLGSISNSHLNLYAGLNVDGSDLLDNLRRAVQINDPLVDPHLELVPGLRTFSTRSLTGGDAQDFGGHAHWTLDLKILLLGSPDEVATHF